MVVGDVEPDDIVSKVENLFEDWKAEGEAEEYAIKPVDPTSARAS